MHEIQTQSVQTADTGVWKVTIQGDELVLEDSTGHQRHRSKGHLTAGVHLAMVLSQMEKAENATMRGNPLQGRDGIDKNETADGA